MNIYDIYEEMLKCVDSETGEIIDEEKLNALEMEREQKIENVACWIKNLRAESEAIKVEKAVLDARKKSADNKIESLKKYLDFALNGEKFTSGKVSISYRKSVSVEVPDVHVLEMAGYDEFLKYKDPEPDKTKIKDFLKNSGESIPGCSLVEKVNIQIK